jgi:hypothetical protein
MPKPSQSWLKRFFYNQNIKRVKSSKKYKNTTEHAIKLLKKIEKEGMTKWISFALSMVATKIKKYGIASYQIQASLDHKWLSSLSSHVAMLYNK